MFTPDVYVEFLSNNRFYIFSYYQRYLQFWQMAQISTSHI